MGLVVLYHSMAFFTGSWFNQPPVISSPVIATIARWLNSFHIYAFTLISGYLFAYLENEKGKYREFGSLLVSKAKRLLIPYIFVSLVWVIPFNIYYFRTTSNEIIRKYLLGEAPSQLWFLLMLFWVFVLTYFINQICGKYDLLVKCVVVLAFYPLSLVLGSIIPNFYQILTAMRYLLYFGAGILLYRLGTKHLENIPALLYVAVDLLLFIVYRRLNLAPQSFIVKLLSLGIGVLLNLVGAVSAFELLDRIAIHINYKNSKAFEVLNKYSFPVYLFHQQIIYCVIDHYNGSVAPVVLVVMCFAVSLFVSLLIAWLLGRFKTTRFLFGMK